MQISYVDYKKNNVQNYGERIFLLLISIYIRFSNMKVFLMHKGIKRKKMRRQIVVHISIIGTNPIHVMNEA